MADPSLLGHEIDGASVEQTTLKSKGLASACNECGFRAWEPGDVKYTVEHWSLRQAEQQREAVADGYGYVENDDINWDAPSREHLCPRCAVIRGLDYDLYYHQNKNAPAFVPKKKRAGESQAHEEVSKKAKPSGTKSDLCQIATKSLTEAKILSTELCPHPTCPLFVAWNGVLVMVYKGFPSSLLRAKSHINKSVPNLEKETFGSMWPKTTLAVVFDNAPDLSLEEMTKLKQICAKYGDKMSTAHTQNIPIHSLSVVEYECRSLETLRSRDDVVLQKKTDSSLEVSQEEIEKVNLVVKEWVNMAEYLTMVNAPGSRMKSYRQSTDGGATCVAFLEGSFSGVG